MSAAMRVQAILQYQSGLPGDVAVNDWCFFSPDDPADIDADRIAITGFLDDFYFAILDYLATYIDAGSSRYRTYEAASFSGAMPFAEEIAFGGGSVGSGINFPAEVAVCLSFSGSTSLAPAVTTAANRRGRVYTGPFKTNVSDDNSAAPAKVDGTFQATLASAGDALRTAVFGLGAWQWVVVSRATGGAITPVERVWVDNALDTQRRRGVEADTRIFLP